MNDVVLAYVMGYQEPIMPLPGFVRLTQIYLMRRNKGRPIAYQNRPRFFVAPFEPNLDTNESVLLAAVLLGSKLTLDIPNGLPSRVLLKDCTLK